MIRRLLLLTVALLVPVSVAAQSETVEYYATDQLGSVRVVFDPNGTILARMDFKPFGQDLSGASGMPANSFRGTVTRDNPLRFLDPSGLTDIEVTVVGKMPPDISLLPLRNGSDDETSVLVVENRSKREIGAVRISAADLFIALRLEPGQRIEVPTSTWTHTEAVFVSAQQFDRQGNRESWSHQSIDLEQWSSPAAVYHVILPDSAAPDIAVRPRQ